MNSVLKKLKSDPSKLNSLKENLRMCVFGVDWADLSAPWSACGIYFTVSELTVHLKYVIIQENKRTIPSKPPVSLPKRKIYHLLEMW